MANKIFGMISDSAQGDLPLNDLRVRAWDHDWPDGDDFMGETITGPDGRYEVRFQPGTWDSSSGIFDLGRPDIYISVEGQTQQGYWVKLGESRVHRNHDLNRDLNIDLGLVLGAPTIRRTGFNPNQHGFHFVNSFLVSPDLLGVNLGEWNMGFCGGMCAGALSRFRDSVEIPQDDQPPVEGSPLHTELMKRQIKAMSPKMLPKMIEWQGSPDRRIFRRRASIAERTRDDWPDLKEILDAGEPAIIVLVRSSGLLGNPTNNHQVLAIGYENDPRTMDLVLEVYDPNKPDRTQTISLNLGLPDGRLQLVDSASSQTRGLFVNPVGETAVDLADFD
jgi:hypothetical protein